MRVNAVIVVTGLLTGLSAAPHAQLPPSSQVVVRGRVVTDAGQALPNARVSVAGTPAVVRSDLDGRFTITALRGSTLHVTKTGFVNADHNLGDLQLRAASIDIRLTRSVVIAGRVLDEYGDPVVGAPVWPATVENSDKPPSGLLRSATDDHGEYRISGLPPGTYTVSVQTRGSDTGDPTVIRAVNDRSVGNVRIYNMVSMGYRTYFPDTLDAAMALPLKLDAGDERLDIDFHVPSARSARQSFSVVPQLVSLKDPVIPSDGDTTIRGTVVSRDGRALPHAEVVLTDDANSLFRVGAADENGTYAFTGVPAGTYRVTASKAGFSLPSDARTMAPSSRSGVVVTVKADEVRDRTDVTLFPWGAISGHVLDEAGEPIADASVGLLLTRYEAGRRRLVAATTARRVTDDRGEFRIFGIPDGQYVLAASIANTPANDVGGFGPTFYPGTGSGAEARLITIAAGDDSKGLDFSLAAAPTARVSGKLVDASGQPTTGGRFTLLARSALAVRIDATIAPDGTFEFRNVPPGQYVIQADRGRLGGSKEGEFGAFPVTVNRADVTGLILQTSTGSTITGRVVFQSIGTTTPSAYSLAISAIPVDFDLAPPSLAVADPKADVFQLVGITGSRRIQVTRVPANWTVKAIVSNGRDVTDHVLQFGRPDQSLDSVEIILTDTVNVVSGTVTDDRGRRVPGAQVIAFSAERDHWYPASRFVRNAETAADGSFAVSGLATGSYFIAAVTRIPAGEEAWRDPAFLDSIRSSARSLSMGDGQTQTINLRVSSR